MSIPKQYNIKWKQGDYITLGKAVANFNKKRNELNKIEEIPYLPERLDYEIVKQGISTRRELNRVIKSLKRFQKEGAEELYVTPAGEQKTKWEYKEIMIQKGIRERALKRELKDLYRPLESGYSLAQMGNQRVKEIEDELRVINELPNRIGYEFTKLERRIKKMGTSDYVMKQSYIYQENFMEELENLAKNLPEFKEVFEYFSKIKNPIEFFNISQKSNVLKDFFVWYSEPDNYSGFTDSKDLATYIIAQYSLDDKEEYGKFRDIENEKIEDKEIKTNKKYLLKTRDGKILKASDNLYELRQLALNSENREIRNALIYLNK